MKWSVGAKIATGCALALLAVLVIGLASYRSATGFVAVAEAVASSLEISQAEESLISHLKDAETSQRGFVITGAERYLEPFTAGVSALEQDVRSLRTLTQDFPNQQRRLDAIDTLKRAKLAELQETIDLRRAKGFEPAMQIIVSDRGKKAMDDIRRTVDEMKTETAERLQQRTTAQTAQIQTTKNTILAGTAAAFVLIGVGGFVLTGNIARPLGQLSIAADKIASGQLRVALPSQTRTDEVGVLSRAFSSMTASLQKTAEAATRIAARDLRFGVTPQSSEDVVGNALYTMIENLRQTTGSLTESVNVVAAAGSQILAVTSQVAAGAAEVGTAIAETTTTIEEVRQTSQVSSQKAKAVADIAQQTSRSALVGQKAVEASIEGMKKIQGQMVSVGESVVKLSEQGQAIGEIIATVNDLAEQSNLLAVNAAIEAARAGEHGKGFSVVAQEVKSLAEQSKQATTQIRMILSEIQRATTSAVLIAEQGNKAVEDGVKQSAAAGDSIRQLAEAISEAAQAATQIAASSQQQLVGTDQVALAMENIKQASMQNAAGTKQVELAAHNLQELGMKLKQMVEPYRV
jgi:methyl-accepting chemotaxis protein